MFNDPKCPKCGSADVERLTPPETEDGPEIPIGEGTWRCFRDDHEFTAYPCPRCGSYNIEGAQAVSGAPLLAPLVVVGCWDCGEKFAPHPSVTG